MTSSARIRADEPNAVFRSSFIVGFPGETEADHASLLEFLADVRLDWAGFFAFSKEDGTTAASMDGEVADVLVGERLRECADVQEPITASARVGLVGETVDVMIDGFDGDDLVGRTYREAPEIDGVVRIIGDSYARPGAIVARDGVRRRRSRSRCEGCDVTAAAAGPTRTGEAFRSGRAGDAGELRDSRAHPRRGTDADADP